MIEWHREKAGTVEMVHDVLKNELGAGVLPSRYFGANAAWLRLAVMAHNVLIAASSLMRAMRSRLAKRECSGKMYKDGK